MKALGLFISLIIVGLSLPSSSFAQMQIETGTWGMDQTSSGYNLDKNTGDRSMTISVSFKTPFERKPTIVLNVTKVDCSTKENIRYNVTPISTSRDGFTIKIDTWADSKIYSIGGYWMAYDDAPKNER